MVDWRKVGKRTGVAALAAAAVFGGWYFLKGRNSNNNILPPEPPAENGTGQNGEHTDFWGEEEIEAPLEQRTGVAALRYEVGCVDAQGRVLPFYKVWRDANNFSYADVEVGIGTSVSCGVVNPADDAVFDHKLERRVTIGGNTAYHRYGGPLFENGRVSFSLFETGDYRLRLAVGDKGGEKAEKRRDLVFAVRYPSTSAQSSASADEGSPRGEPLRTLPLERSGGLGR